MLKRVLSYIKQIKQVEPAQLSQDELLSAQFLKGEQNV